MTDTSIVVAAARSWIGTPFRHQASLKGVGCDCLGLVRGVWREVIGPEPEGPPAYPPDWAATGRDLLREAVARHCAPAAGIEPGIVVLFRWRAGDPAGHCAIATGPDTMVHTHAGAGVAEVSLAVWRRRVAGLFRLP